VTAELHVSIRSFLDRFTQAVLAVKSAVATRSVGTADALFNHQSEVRNTLLSHHRGHLHEYGGLFKSDRI
jgi:hypothetical protein